MIAHPHPTKHCRTEGVGQRLKTTIKKLASAPEGLCVFGKIKSENNAKKNAQPSKGMFEKRIMLDKNRENMLIEEVEEIWKQIDQENNWHFLEQKISKVRNIGSLLESQKLVNF